MTNENKKLVSIGVGALLVGSLLGNVATELNQVDPMQKNVGLLNGAIEELEAQAMIDAEAIENLNTQLDVKPTEIKVIEEVEVIKIVENEVIVEDDTMLKLMCDKLEYDNIMECKSEVEAEDNALDKAIYQIELDILDMLEDEDLIEDEDEAKIIKIYKDFEDVDIIESDYSDSEYEFDIKVKILDEEDDEKIKVLARVVVEDGDAELKFVTLED